MCGFRAGSASSIEDKGWLERHRKEELQRLEGSIAEKTSTLQLLKEMGETRTEKIEKELEFETMQRDKYKRLLEAEASPPVGVDTDLIQLEVGSEPEPEPEPDPLLQLTSTQPVQEETRVIPWQQVEVKAQVGLGAFKDVHHGKWNGRDVVSRTIIFTGSVSARSSAMILWIGGPQAETWDGCVAGGSRRGAAAVPARGGGVCAGGRAQEPAPLLRALRARQEVRCHA